MTLRPPRDDEFDAMLELMNAHQLAAFGETDATPEELRLWLTTPYVVVENDIRVLERADEADLHGPGDHQSEHLLGVSGPDADADAGVLRAEPLQHGREHVRADRRRAADDELALAAAAQRLKVPLAVLGGLERAQRVRQVGLPEVGEACTAAVADEELLPDLALERLQPGAERGLGQEEPLRRARDVPGARDGDEGLKVGEEHRGSSIHGAYGNDMKYRFCK